MTKVFKMNMLCLYAYVSHDRENNNEIGEINKHACMEVQIIKNEHAH